MTRPRVAVLASGRGSSLQAVIDAIAGGTLDAALAGVFSDRADALALTRVPEALRWHADAGAYASRDDFDAALAGALQAVRADWILCAGYMRILGAPFVERFRGRLLNIHPSLLPKYRGLHTHRRALRAGDDEHGASVHFVVPELDAGAVIAQARVSVDPGDSAEALAGRVLAQEHRLLVATLRLCVAGRVAERNDRVFLDGHALFTPLRLDCDASLQAA